MGGHAFEQAVAEDGKGVKLSTPRMSPEQYQHLKAVYFERLKTCLPHFKIATLIEAPEKADYGDMDFIVASNETIDLLKLARQLGARAILVTGNEKSQKCNLAVPKDGSRSSTPTAVYKLTYSKKPAADSDLIEDELSQLDIDIMSTELFHWHTFYASYSDLAGMLGKTSRPYGFTITDKGLHLRLQELDDSKSVPWLRVADTEGFIHLSNDPDEVMQFFGLDSGRYHEGFATLHDFYGWLASCRFLSPEVVQVKRDDSNERQKERKRTVYSRFFEEYLPKTFGISAEESDESSSGRALDRAEPDFSLTRSQYLQEAISAFSKQEEYRTLRDSLVLSIQNQTAERLIKPLIAAASGRKDKGLTEILRAFRRWVIIDEAGSSTVAEKAHTDREAQLHHWLAEDGAELRNHEAVKQWIEGHWEEVRSCERHRGKAIKTE